VGFRIYFFACQCGFFGGVAFSAADILHCQHLVLLGAISGCLHAKETVYAKLVLPVLLYSVLKVLLASTFNVFAFQVLFVFFFGAKPQIFGRFFGFISLTVLRDFFALWCGFFTCPARG